MNAYGRFLLVFLAMSVAQAVRAQEQRGCDKFAWDLTREQTSLRGKTLPVVVDGSTPTSAPVAFTLQLVPADDAKLPKPPERMAKAATSSAGFVAFDAPPASGVYQVTLSAYAWIDLIQDDAYLKPVAFSGAIECPGVRKSVRFQLEAKPFVLQVSDVAASVIGIVVAPQPGSKPN